MIPPEYHALYEWTFEDSPESATITFHFPPTFASSTIHHELTHDSTALIVTFTDPLPLVQGTLHSPVSSVSASHTDDSLTLTLTKVDPAAWLLPITSYYPGTSEADPQSCFLMYEYALAGGVDRAAVGAFEKAIRAGFCPALRAGFQLLSANPENMEFGFRMLCTAVDTYQDPIATLMLALFFEARGSPQQAFRAFKMAAVRGMVQGLSYLGQYLSPLCAKSAGGKNVENAIKLFEQARKADPQEPISCHELAMLYYNGVGVEKDVRRAEELQAIARESLPDISPLSIVGGEESGSQGWIVAAVALAVGVAAVITALRVWRRKP
jgi:TPR repeat protein